MHMLFTAFTIIFPALCLVGAVLAYIRSAINADKAEISHRAAQRVYMLLREDSSRITALERDVATLRRELRKLSGRFYSGASYASESSARNGRDVPAVRKAAGVGVIVEAAPAAVCANYAIAQSDGPGSDAAKCGCAYCEGRRLAKDQFRSQQADRGHLDPEWVNDHRNSPGQVDGE